MALIQLAISFIVLGFLYRRMIKRETPTPIGKAQAIIPVFLGVISLLISFAFFLMNGVLLLKLGYSKEAHSLVFRSLFSSFTAAGLPEETAKLLMILLTLGIFRSRIQNVYEYILAGAAVGFGFTVFEEFLYGSGDIATAVMRIFLLAGHMVFGILMAKHLGLAKYRKMTGSGSALGEYALAFLIPLCIHTVYDACLVNNYFLKSEDEQELSIGLIIAVAALLVLFVLQIVVLLRLKKNTEKYCAMTFGDAAAEQWP